jgi:hypothetical protein
MRARARMRGERVVYYGFEEPKPILMRNFASIGMRMDALEKAGNLRVICRYPEASSLEDLLVDLRLGMEQFGPSLVVMDSISSIEHASSEKGFPPVHDRHDLHPAAARAQRAAHTDGHGRGRRPTTPRPTCPRSPTPS